jgi:hypothetical protein
MVAVWEGLSRVVKEAALPPAKAAPQEVQSGPKRKS